MTYVITAPCATSKDAACADVCPAQCIHPTPDESGFADAAQLYINPAECIDCAACMDVCPVGAIFPEAQLPADMLAYAQTNRSHYT